MGSSGANRSTRAKIGQNLADEIAAFVAAEELATGTHLATGALAERFAVSRWPIEQALKTLAASGVLEHRPARGFFVAAANSAARRTDGPPDPVHAAYLALAEDLVEQRVGCQITEKAVRERYGLTQRQANDLFARYAKEGLAEKRVGYGWSFTHALATPQALRQTFELRLMIEPQTLRLPGFSLSPDVMARLRRSEEDLLSGGIERLAPDALYDRNTRFHEALIAGSGNPFLAETLRRMNRVRRLLTYKSMQDRARYHAQAREHLAILDAIEANRMEQAAVLMQVHLEAVMGRLRAIGILKREEGAE